jgi:hypothetical protein
MSFFAKQRKLNIVLDTKIDLTGSSNPKILYVDPSGVKGSWAATVSGTTVTYDVQTNDKIIPGGYSMQSYVEFAGKPIYGEIVLINFQDSLD